MYIPYGESRSVVTVRPARPFRRAAVAAAFLLLSPVVDASAEERFSFANETPSRLVMDPSLQGDNLEKSFAVGDFDRDLDQDLVCVRKFPGSITGGFRNLLLMNEDGVLVDRTVEYGAAADVEGSQGLLDPTNDRDVEAVDLDGDGWLDLVVVTTMSDHLDALLGQPRVYRNLGLDAKGRWLGFRFEAARIPTLFAKTGQPANPRTCDVAVGDLTGDGYPDLFLVDYDTPETSGTICIDLNGDGDTADAGECQQSPPENPLLDYDNKLLVNWGDDPAGPGPGHFFDTGTTRMTATQLASKFGTKALAADFNLDGSMDLARINSLNPDQDVAILYGRTGPQEGVLFNGPVTVSQGGPYNMETGDLNNDGRMDLVVVDDGKDKYLLNHTLDALGQAKFTSYTIADSLWEFGSTPRLSDLDRDGFADILIADVDIDLGPFCPSSGRRAKIYANQANPPNVTFAISSAIPPESLASTFDIAPIDLNGDAYPDLVIGRCAGIEVWMNQPPVGLSFLYPEGRPETLVPGEEVSFPIMLAIAGGGEPVDPQLLVSNDGKNFVPAALEPFSDRGFLARLPMAACGEVLRYRFTAGLTNGGSYQDPPEGSFTAVPSNGSESMIVDEFEIESGWTVGSTGPVTAGHWERTVPIGIWAGSVPVAPSADFTPFEGVSCFVTLNAPANATPSSGDLDGGPVTLTSPPYDLLLSDVEVHYGVWFHCDDSPPSTQADRLLVEVSADGTEWVLADEVLTRTFGWRPRTFRLNDVLVPSATTRIRFVVADLGNNSLTEAGIDSIRIVATGCSPAGTPGCPGDLNGDGLVSSLDLGAVLAAWGQLGDGPTDLDGDGLTSGPDLAAVLSSWGPCP
jgi:hypothetical protein